MNISDNIYTTSDLYLTAYLKVKGFKFNVDKLKSKSNFVFNNTPELLSNVNDYLSEMGSCEPLAFTNAIKNLKNYLYNNK
jgi:hypothetical protein